MSLSITSGTSHLIIPKRIVLTTIMIGLGAMLGMYLSEHMRAARTATILKTKNQAIKDKNELLVSEKEGYSDMLKELEGHMTEWAEEGGVPDEFLDKHKGFHDIAEALMKQVQSVHDLLIEKEYELIDKEALLEYQEQQLMDSEELEDRMVGYINTMATKLVALKQPLPAGLEAEPFFYVDMAPAAEGPPGVAPVGAPLRRRRTRRKRKGQRRGGGGGEFGRMKGQGCCWGYNRSCFVLLLLRVCWLKAHSITVAFL